MKMKFSLLLINISHVISKEAMSFLLDESHVVFAPGVGGKEHVLPPQNQNIQAPTLQLRHHRQQLKHTKMYISH